MRERSFFESVYSNETSGLDTQASGWYGHAGLPVSQGPKIAGFWSADDDESIKRSLLNWPKELGPHYRYAICSLCERTVSIALGVPLSALQAKSRLNAEVALARQIAMYLCHTMFGILMTEVGYHFKRDRTTVAHACALVEDKRDDLSFDVLLCQLEALLADARDALGLLEREKENAIGKRHCARGTSSQTSAGERA